MSYTNDVNKFVRTATWLDDTDAPIVGSLKSVSKELDAQIKAKENLSGTLVSQHRMLFNMLVKSRPVVEVSSDDGLEDDLRALGI